MKCDCCEIKIDDPTWFDCDVTVDGKKLEAGALLCPKCEKKARPIKSKKVPHA